MVQIRNLDSPDFVFTDNHNLHFYIPGITLRVTSSLLTLAAITDVEMGWAMFHEVCLAINFLHSTDQICKDGIGSSNQTRFSESDLFFILTRIQKHFLIQIDPE